MTDTTTPEIDVFAELKSLGNRAYENGHEDGWSEGYDCGREAGRDDAMRKVGWDEGYDRGFDVGRDQGVDHGFNKGLVEAARTLSFLLGLDEDEGIELIVSVVRHAPECLMGDDCCGEVDDEAIVDFLYMVRDHADQRLTDAEATLEALRAPVGIAS